MPDSSELLNNIFHYQKSIGRYLESRNDSKIIHCILKLFNMPVTMSHLEKTGIGRTVNSLRKLGGEVGDAANTLVKKWKDMVSKKSDCDESEQNANEPDSTYDPQNYKCESNSSHRYSDKSKNSDRKEKSHKQDKHNNSKSDKHDEYKRQSTSEAKHKSKKRDQESRDRSSCDSDNIDSESGVALDSDNSSSEEEEADPVVHTKHNKYDKDRKYEQKHTKYEESFSERSSKHKRDLDKDTKHDRSHSKEKRKQDYHSDNDRKRKRQNSSSSDSSEHVSKPSSNSSSKFSGKRKRDDSPSDEETKSKTLKKSSSHSSSRESSRREHKKENRSESDNEISSRDTHKSAGHKSKESSSREYKKENKSEYDRKESKSSSKSDSKSERKKENSHRDDRSKSSDRTKKESDKKKDRKSNGKDKSKSKSTSKSSTSNNTSASSSSNSNKIVDIGSGSGTSFAEALGMLEPTTSKASIKKSKSSETNNKFDKSVPERSVKEKLLPEKLSISDKLDIVIPPPPKNELELNIASLLPPITPNYRPVANPFLDNCSSRYKIMNDDEALSLVMSQKNQRTKVYSGNKCFFGTVPTLFELCIRILQDNIDALEYTGGVPFVILKPVLDKATPDQLFTLEHHNPYLIDDTDDIWQFHCQKEFRNKKRLEMESWREMYMRCLDEREAKLKALTENIKLAQDKSIPVRQTKLAYVDSVVKPPREVIRRQAKSGFDKKPIVTPSSRLNALATSGAAGQVSVPSPVKPSSSGGSSAAIKPKKAPLMQKTLAFLKGNRFRR